jgi:hypothetical protein
MSTETGITTLLAERHKNDVFVPQCKTGPSWGTGLAIMDAWAMAKSWAHPMTWGYEIKCSRADFLKDHKWPSYLDYCNAFYFVCPPKIIDPEELPRDVGLLWVASTSTRLTTKRKAAHRDVTIPEDLFRYILMARVKIGPDKEENIAYWRNWLSEKANNQILGKAVSKRLQKRLAEEVVKVQYESEKKDRRIWELERVQQVCDECGIDLDHPWNVEDRVRQAIAAIPQGLIGNLERALDGLNQLMRKRDQDCQEAVGR